MLRSIVFDIRMVEIIDHMHIVHEKVVEVPGGDDHVDALRMMNRVYWVVYLIFFEISFLGYLHILDQYLMSMVSLDNYVDVSYHHDLQKLLLLKWIMVVVVVVVVAVVVEVVVCNR